MARWIGAVLLLLGWAAAAAAEETRQRFDIYGGGLRLGSLGLDARVEGGRYAASGRVSGGGLIGLFVTFEFSGTAIGRLREDGRLQPLRYQAVSDDGDTRRETTILYEGGTPVSVTTVPERRARSYDARPADQSGTVDPISATFSLLRDRPAGMACGRTVEVFDGNRRSRLRVEPRRAGSGGEWICGGVYQRVDGYSRDLMAERVNFPFELVFEESGGVMRVVRFQTQTTFGRVSAVRR